MSGTTPPPGSEPNNDNSNPYAQPNEPASGQPWASGPPDQPPAWSGSAYDANPVSAPEPPPSILNAVKLMYVGAALSLVGVLFAALSTGSIRDAVEESDPNLTESEIDAAANLAIGVAVVVSLLGVALWLWMAVKNKQGRSWARVVATVLGGLNIVFTLFSLGNTAGLNLVVNLVTVVLAAVILWFLYRPESTEYYRAVSRMTS
ncbi:hypothetical protein CLV30_11893 [Haloactinopolyspora alba]|uniref:Uncharacterized protein n=1 Tax=Haloactinopolyspora alba TaxID=648780 RepID=A0A2P8DPS3_9ACTN|nr:hypothetical protein [Haloactinopolyspora alba]PSK99191.1 hypothetical protein CLV30_11893 [Haloactinopolyspora alba]